MGVGGGGRGQNDDGRGSGGGSGAGERGGLATAHAPSPPRGAVSVKGVPLGGGCTPAPACGAGHGWPGVPLTGRGPGRRSWRLDLAPSRGGVNRSGLRVKRGGSAAGPFWANREGAEGEREGVREGGGGNGGVAGGAGQNSAAVGGRLGDTANPCAGVTRDRPRGGAPHPRNSVYSTRPGCYPMVK